MSTLCERPPDEQLLEAWRRGDLLAGHELFHRYHHSVTLFCRRRVGEDVEDLVQDVFVRLVKSLERPVLSFRAYLFGIVRNVLYERYRASGRECERRRSLELTLSAAEDTYEDRRICHEQNKLLVAALRTLSLETQMILELRYWQEMSMAEIGYLMGLETGAVRTRVSRARKRIAEQMAKLASSPALLRTTLHRLTQWEVEIEAAIGARVQEPDD